jgi:hypothetical protein
LQESVDGNSQIRIVHGIADAGPLDLYVDDALALFGIGYTQVSADLTLASGQHRIAVVPSGGSLEDAIAAGTVDLTAGERTLVTLIGVAGNASVGLFPVDAGPLGEGLARFRIINGLADAGEVVPAFSGGEAISAPLAFGDASEYAAIEPGVYDLDVLDVVSGAPVLSLAQGELAEGAATDLILIGVLADGSAQVIMADSEVAVVRLIGNVASLVPGRCGEEGEPSIELGVVRTGEGEPVGVTYAPAMAQGFALAPIAFEAVVTDPHAIIVQRDDAEGSASSDIVACGEIGGRLTDTGALVIALQPADDDGPAGVAVLAPSLEDPTAIGVSIFLEAATGIPQG